MKQHPILFSTPMMQALLAGRKTQTRRTAGLSEINKNPDDWQFEWADYSLDKPWRFTQLSTVNEKSLSERSFNQVALKCSYGWAGDELWVRETWAKTVNVNCMDNWPARPHKLLEVEDVHGKPHSAIIYAADGYWQWCDDDGFTTDKSYWKPAIHMPREASRFLLKVKHIKPQRIADISEADCIAEGIEPVQSFDSGEGVSNRQLYKNYLDHGYTELMPKDSFISLWQSINGIPKPIQEIQNGKLVTTGYIVYPFDDLRAKEWERKTKYRDKPLTVIVNPWVWVVEFEKI